LTLASASPRRKGLLQGLGLEFAVCPYDGKEPSAGRNESPEDYALRIARLKAMGVAKSFPGSVVIGADTSVVLDGKIMGKPRDREDAICTLTELSGRRHQVVTGCSFVCLEKEFIQEFTVSSWVWIASFSREIINAYVDTGEPMDKAGSYAVQGMGAFMIEKIEGSYTNVVGLPLFETIDMLLKNGFLTR
jgi:septum formation protein